MLYRKRLHLSSLFFTGNLFPTRFSRNTIPIVSNIPLRPFYGPDSRAESVKTGSFAKFLHKAGHKKKKVKRGENRCDFYTERKTEQPWI